MKRELSKFWRSLCRHPGVEIVLLLQAFGIAAGLKRTDGNWLVGLVVMSVFWIPVLWTAWTGRNIRHDEE